MSYAVILLYQPDGTVRDIPLSAECVFIGRSSDCDVIVEGKLISRRHVCIRRVGQGYYIEDLGSQNGTTVNNIRLKETLQLHDGDVIALGGMGKMVFSDSESTSSLLQPFVVGVWLDRDKQDVWIDGQCLNPKLSPVQYKLLEVLSFRAEQIVSRTEIIAMVWPNISEGVSDEAVDALIKRVRARMSEIPSGDQYLITYRSRGFMLKAPSR